MNKNGNCLIAPKLKKMLQNQILGVDEHNSIYKQR